MAKLTPSTYDQPPAGQPRPQPAREPEPVQPVEPDPRRLEQYRPELTGHCLRLLRNAADADDAVQETLMRAWRRLDSFEGRGSLRAWLYRIATNVCYDLMQGRRGRPLPMDMGEESCGPRWMGPAGVAHGRIEPSGGQEARPDGDPADAAVGRESVRLAFLAVLCHLPPRQRAVLLLREVLGWRASEVAELLDSSVASVNSALQRARATLAAHELTADAPIGSHEDRGRRPDRERSQARLTSYLAAFQSLDVEALVTLLRDDASEAGTRTSVTSAA